jgi:hypothetical protein
LLERGKLAGKLGGARPDFLPLFGLIGFEQA